MHQKKSVNSSERVVYFNGSLVKESEAKISIYDSSLMFGDMVFTRELWGLKKELMSLLLIFR